MSIYAVVGLTVTLLACGFALWKGGKFEQAGGILVFIAGTGMFFAQEDTGSYAPKYIFLAIDVALLVAFVVLARQSPRSWPVFASAFQLIKITAHVTSLIGLHIATFAYLSAISISDYGVLATIALGTWNAWRERAALDYARL